MRNANQKFGRRWLALALPALVPAMALAEPLLLDAPVPQTAPAASVPSEPPAINPLADPALSQGKILVLPFVAVNPGESSPWLGKSIQQSLTADLTVAAPGRVTTSDQVAGTIDAAIAAGKQSGAHFVVAGGFTTMDRELRITGQVVDVDSGKPVAGLKTTGDPSRLFQMEDALALQIRGQVLGQHPIMLPPANEQPPVNPANNPQLLATQPPAAATGITSDPGQYAPPAAPQYYSPYAVAPTPPIYGTDYSSYTTYPGYYDAGYVSDYSPYYYGDYASYPYYGCGYGLGWCSPFGIGFGLNFSDGFFHGHRDHDRDYGSRNYGYRGVSVGGGRASLGVGIGANASFRSSNFGGRASVSPSFSRAATVRSSGVPYRSAAIYSRGSVGRTSGFSGGFHASSSFHSSGGGGAHFSSGGGHGGGGGHAGGGHR